MRVTSQPVLPSPAVLSNAVVSNAALSNTIVSEGALTSPQRSGRFFFDGLPTPVRARVAHQDAAGMTLRQELPFLQLHGRLRDEEGREGSLENVSVMVRNGVPSLVLDIRYKGGREDATVPFLMESTRAMRATHALLRNAQASESALPVETRSVRAPSLESAPAESASFDGTFVERASGSQSIDHQHDAFAAQRSSFDPSKLPRTAPKARRDETLPYGIQTESATTEPAPSIPTVEELMRFTSAPSAPIRHRGGVNGWWARLWQRLVLRFFARA